MTSVDGSANTAPFTRALADATKESVMSAFDMLHAVAPQKAPDLVRVSPLVDAGGCWVDLDPEAMQHKTCANYFALADVGATPNAKTVATARKQTSVVAHNVLVGLGKESEEVRYDECGSCPLTVERCKIVPAEFLCDGKLAPSFPKWVIHGAQPSRAARLLKERILSPRDCQGMLKGRQWMAQPEAVG